jgi:signal transduction histidine kinase
MHHLKLAIVTTWRTAFLRNLFILSTGILFLFPTIDRVFIYPLFTNYLITDTKKQSVLVAQHLSLNLTPSEEGLTLANLPPSLVEEMPQNLATLGLWKIKIFGKNGKTIFSSNSSEIGEINKHSYFLNEVATGKVLTNLVRKNTKSLEGQTVYRDVVETYVPVIENNMFQGTFEIYFDITDRLSDLDSLLVVSQYVVGAVTIILFIALMVALTNAALSIDKHRLAEENLFRAKQEAEEANQAKSEFLASMSHDLRTPLNAIMGFSDMMRQKAFGPLGNEHYEEYVEDIHNSGSLLVSLINDILDLSKIEAGKYELSDEPVSISAIVDVCIRQLTALASISNLTMSSDVPSDLPHIYGDERATIQVLSNLISNAIKFTPDGGMFAVRAYLNDSQGISITVKDTGIGMSPDGIIKALKPFEQADGTHSRRHEGTGLGLHLCTNLMKLFGGSLLIESEPGQGTTVTIHFPPERTILPAL